MADFTSIWQSLAQALGDQWTTFTATTASSSTTTVVCEDLADSTVGNDRYGEYYLYPMDGDFEGQQRVVLRTGFAKDTGTLSLSRAYASNPEDAVTYALTKRFGVIKEGTWPGLRDFVNEALREMDAHDFISVTGATGQPRYTLPTATHWWITDAERIINVWQPYPESTDRRRVDPQHWDLIYDGENVVLQLSSGYSDADTFELEVWRPANSRLKLNGVWSDQSNPMAGLALGDDEAIPNLKLVTTCALANAYMAILESPGLAEQRKYWEGRLKIQNARVATEKDKEKKRVYSVRPRQFVGSSSGDAL
jgi:hypothetical protein